LPPEEWCKRMMYERDCACVCCVIQPRNTMSKVCVELTLTQVDSFFKTQSCPRLLHSLCTSTSIPLKEKFLEVKIGSKYLNGLCSLPFVINGRWSKICELWV
jgi:hypothetical protein